MMTYNLLQDNKALIDYITTLLKLQPEMRQEIPLYTLYLMVKQFLGIYHNDKALERYEMNTFKKWVISVGFTLVENKEGLPVIR